MKSTHVGGLLLTWIVLLGACVEAPPLEDAGPDASSRSDASAALDAHADSPFSMPPDAHRLDAAEASDADEPDASVDPCGAGGSCPDAGVDAGGLDSGAGLPDSGPVGRDAGQDAGPTPDTSAVVQLALGGAHTCLLRASGLVRCWGTPGALGPTPGVESARSIAADGRWTCATSADGSVRCWDGSATTTRFPVPGISPMSVTTAYCGLKAAGGVECWEGTAPSPLTTIALDSYAVTSGLPPEHCALLADGMTVSCSGGRAAPAAFAAGITRIGLGAAHSCALASGTVWCWGNNGRGQVGTWDLRAALPPTSTGRSSSDTGAVAYSEIAVGRWHTCGRRTDGSVWCWGDNALSQLGRVTTLAYDYMPGEVRLSGARMDATTLAAGRDHTCAGLRDGRVVCWGSNAEGQLGRWVPGLMTTEPVEPEGFWIE